jgi:hypothetical protein
VALPEPSLAQSTRVTICSCVFAVAVGFPLTSGQFLSELT